MKANLHTNAMNVLVYQYIKNQISSEYLILQDVEHLHDIPEFIDI